MRLILVVNVRQNQYARNNGSNRGFTLSELLITLAILGIIAAFTIPKLLQQVERQEARAKTLDIIAALEQAWYTRKVRNQIIYGPGNPDAYLYGNLRPMLNVADGGPNFIPTSVLPIGHPCGVPGFAVTIPAIYHGWLVFPNGAVVTGVGAPAFGGPNGDGSMDNRPWNDPGHNQGLNYVLCIDFNGKSGSNLPGQDIFFGNFNQYGGFAGPAPSENAKNFNWGSLANPGVDNVYTWGGPAGTIYCSTCAPPMTNAGSNTRVPPAIVGALLQE